MEGTVKMCRELGYTDQQAELVGKIDDLFEEAIKLDMISPLDALQLGRQFGLFAGKHTGKL